MRAGVDLKSFEQRQRPSWQSCPHVWERHLDDGLVAPEGQRRQAHAAAAGRLKHRVAGNRSRGRAWCVRKRMFLAASAATLADLHFLPDARASHAIVRQWPQGKCVEFSSHVLQLATVIAD